jgi:hypothetical protein
VSLIVFVRELVESGKNDGFKLLIFTNNSTAESAFGRAPPHCKGCMNWCLSSNAAWSIGMDCSCMWFTSVKK